MIACFESELVMDWPRVARTVRELGRRGEAGIILWTFLDFVVSQRPPLFVLLLPFVNRMVKQVELI
jgi:protein unc-80